MLLSTNSSTALQKCAKVSDSRADRLLTNHSMTFVDVLSRSFLAKVGPFFLFLSNPRRTLLLPRLLRVLFSLMLQLS